MNFEHLVQINDPADPLLTPLSRRQLWQGLIRRVERPEEFLVGVEHVAIVARGEGWLQREMRLGTMLVCDRITLEEEQRVLFDTAPSEHHGGGQFVMSIEEPGEGALFVRFSYRTALSETPTGNANDDANFVEYVKSAYRDTDVDAVRWIRELAETGELD